MNNKISTFSLNDIKLFVEQNYDFEVISFIEKGPTPYLYLIHAQKQKLFLKFHDPRTFQASNILERVFQVIGDKHLGAQYILSKSGKLINISQNLAFSIFHYIPGFSATKEQDIIPSLVSLHQTLGSINGHTLKNHFNREIGKLSQHLIEFNLAHYHPIISSVEQIAQSYPKQIIHGDLHKGNIIVNQTDVRFIDFNAAKYWLPYSDVSFCAFRHCDNDYNFYIQFIMKYSALSGKEPIEIGTACALTIYEILERIVFILLKSKQGDTYWEIDLDNQYKLLEQAENFLNKSM